MGEEMEWSGEKYKKGGENAAEGWTWCGSQKPAFHCAEMKGEEAWQIFPFLNAPLRPCVQFSVCMCLYADVPMQVFICVPSVLECGNAG